MPRPVWRRGRLAVRPSTLALAALLLFPLPAHAQLGIVESLFRNVTDVGFYAGRGNYLPASETLRTGSWGLNSFGLELLFGVGETDSTAAWTYELAVGYGQIAGFELKNQDLDLRGAIRELPAITIYASHEPTGLYLGLRSGLLQTHSLQLYDSEGSTFTGAAQSFQLGAALGYARLVQGVYPFIEGGWMLRNFPGIEWKSPKIPEGVPRSLRLSGWQLLVGMQVALKPAK